MSIAWPVSLEDKVDSNSFGFNFGDSNLRTDMDVGPKKVRRRSTRPIDSYVVSIWLNNSTEFTTFYNFYNTTINGGVSVFQFTDPITNNLYNFRFTGPPSVKHLGAGVYTLSMSWEKMP